MVVQPRLHRIFCLIFSLAALASFARGHALDTNLYLQIHLKEDRLTYELDVGCFQFPPLTEVKFAQPDTQPTLEQKREEIERFFRKTAPSKLTGSKCNPFSPH